MNTGIYAIQNTVTGKRYIGGSRNFANRWRQHRQSLDRGDHHSATLQQDWRAHGAQAFVFKPVIICGEENLLMYEQTAMDHYKPEYNTAKFAGTQLGYRHTPETRAHMSAVNSRIGNPGYVHTEESKAKISASKTGKKFGAYDADRVARTAASMRKGKNALTEDEVRTIRKMNAEGRPHKEAAELLGRTYWAVADVVRRRTFQWVE